MPAATRRSVRWFATAAAVVIAGAIALGIALRGGAVPEALAPGGPSTGAPGAIDAGITALTATPEAAQAMRLVASAKAEVASGHLAQARVLLAQAYAADPRPSTLLELATVALQIGDCRDARRAAQRVAAAAPGEPLVGQARELLGKIGRCD